MEQSDALELTQPERNRIAKNRERAEQLRSSQVVANDRNVYVTVSRTKITRTEFGDGGFILEDDAPIQAAKVQFEKDEESSDVDESNENGDNPLGRTRRRLKRRRSAQQSVPNDVESVPIDEIPFPPDMLRPSCDLCERHFDESYLRKNFDVDVCDRCRDPKGIHSLVTKSTAKDRYLLNDVDLDVREPKLRFILKRNPHNSYWGGMRLYLEAQTIGAICVAIMFDASTLVYVYSVERILTISFGRAGIKNTGVIRLESFESKLSVIAERAVELWGDDDGLEAERDRRNQRLETSKLKRFSKKIKELKLQTRSSLFMKTHKTHEHVFGPETYDEESDLYVKRCTECDYKNSFEKL